MPELSYRGLEFVLRVRALALVMDHELARSAAAENVEIEEALLLSALRRTGPPYRLRPTEIYKLLSITSGAATARIARLVGKGLAERVGDAEDRRSYLVQLSPNGRGAIDRIMAKLSHLSDRALDAGGVDADTVLQLRRDLAGLERGWEAVVPAAENPLVRLNDHLAAPFNPAVDP